MVTQMKILIVDDNPVPAESLKLRIEESMSPVDVRCHDNFATAFEVLEDDAPDAVVLDIFYGNPDLARNEGDTLRQEIWAKHFCPLVIYTAKPEDAHARMAEHPFVSLIPKSGGKDSEEAVVEQLRAFEPHIKTLRTIRDEAVRLLGGSLRDVCGLVWNDSHDVGERSELIGRITRRRVAAAMDLEPTPAKPIRSWERYVYPPICEDLLTGDVLRELPNATEPEVYRVVVSPSCDLVHGRTGCLEHVLVAHCEKISAYLAAAQLPAGTAQTKLKERLPTLLNDLHKNGFMCLPELPGVFPVMTVNLRSLQLIEYDAISLSGTAAGAMFRRVASVDSPFRESLGWAFAQVAGRPALPDIDQDKTVETIVAAVGRQS
jgi:CheY-like chemotaxis protein